ncbi:hypothetical protein PF008_g430 [Phytophthora fragariae]|uniref:Uncharacterized protein n=1 Tax=Phytophthora fragariae TaxID=53985 RepID=A0A6G0SMZ3_9STRA|nr:hypothetical protein PF008_g430 [Phytophthora fragariae]
MTVERGGLGHTQAGASPSSDGTPSRAALDQLAAAAERAPHSSLSSPRDASAALLASLPSTDDFDFDPGLVEPFLLLDEDGVPLGSRGALSPAPARALDEDESPSDLVDLYAILAEPDDDSEDVVVDQGSPAVPPALPAPVSTVPWLVASSNVDEPARLLRRLRLEPSSSRPRGPTLRSTSARLRSRRLDVETRVAAPAAPARSMETQMAVYHDEPLPRHPDRHPGNNHRNYYDSSAPWDPELEYGFAYFMDRHGDPPNRSYLVKWDTNPLQLSWVWEEQLAGYPELKDHVRPDTFYRYADEHFAGAGASATGRCIMEALHVACYHLDIPSLITDEHWERFEKQHKREMTYGVKREDMAEFLKFLERDCVPLDYNELYKARKIDSLNSLAGLIAFVRRETLDRGCYLVCAGQHRLDHCFVLVVWLHRGPLMAYDVWEEFEDPPCGMERLTNIKWINTVKAIYRIKEGPKPAPPRGKRLTKTEKKRARKAAVKSAKNAKKRAKKRSHG